MTWLRNLLGRWLMRGRNTQQVEQARERLQAAERDDLLVKQLDKQVERLARDNHLAPAIIRALGIRR